MTPSRPSRSVRLTALAVLVAALLVAAWWLLTVMADAEQRSRRSPAALAFETAPQAWLAQPQPLSHLQQQMAAGQLRAVAIVIGGVGSTGAASTLLYTLANGQQASTTLPAGAGLQDRLIESSASGGFTLATVELDPRPMARRWLDGAHALLAPLLLLGLVVTAVVAGPRLQAHFSGAAQTLGERPATRLEDVVGNEQAKAALRRVQAFMADPAVYAKLGARAPRGVLLVGPPGTGKTLLARALAGECGSRFIAVDGSYFTSAFYGAGVSKVKELFKLARSHAPCVLFIDEVDGIGRRGSGASGAESELNRIINRVLVEMDGFTPLDNVVVIAATNHADNVDEAMRRPGRFDTIVPLALPTLPDRQALFELYIARTAHDGTADTAALARLAAGLSPADIANLVNQAASSAAEAGAERVSEEHLLRAIETQQLGGEVSAMKSLMGSQTRTRLAVHEAGHALVAHGLGVGSVERVTIEPRGQALGVTHVHRASEDPLFAQAELGGRLAMMLGGREAEMLVLGSVSSGASDDLKRASELAVKMVSTLGFSERFGLLSVAGVPAELLGPGIQAEVLAEARALLESAQSACRELLTRQRLQLDALSEALLRREVLSGDELRALLV